MLSETDKNQVCYSGFNLPYCMPVKGARTHNPNIPPFSYYPQGIFDGIINYFESYPKPPLNSLIAFYYQYSFNKDRASQKYTVLPDGCVDLKFYCNHGIPKVYICGTTKYGRSTNLPCDGSEWFGIRFWPGRFYRLLAKSAEEFTENEVDTAYLKGLEIGALSEKIVREKSFFLRTSIIERYLEENIKKLNQIPKWINSVIHSVITSYDKENAHRLLPKINYSDRHIRREFKRFIGISPRCFSRIVRLQSALKEIQENKKKSMVDIALEHGFYDHSHFTHEFKEFYGKPPSKIIPSPTFRSRLPSGLTVND